MQLWKKKSTAKHYQYYRSVDLVKERLAFTFMHVFFILKNKKKTNTKTTNLFQYRKLSLNFQCVELMSWWMWDDLWNYSCLRCYSCQFSVCIFNSGYYASPWRVSAVSVTASFCSMKERRDGNRKQGKGPCVSKWGMWEIKQNFLKFGKL